MRLFRLGKKGQAARDVFAVIVFLFSFAILTIIGVLVFTAIIDGYQTALATNTDVVKAGNQFKVAFAVYDTIMVIMMVVFIIGIGVTSIKLAARPVGFIVTLVLAPLFGLVSYFFNFLFQEIVSNGAFTTVIATFSNTILICTNLHWVALALVVVGAIGLFAKKPQGQFLT